MWNPPLQLSFLGFVIGLSFVNGVRLKKTVACYPAIADGRQMYSSRGKYLERRANTISTLLAIVGSLCSIAGFIFAIYVYIKRK